MFNTFDKTVNIYLIIISMIRLMLTLNQFSVLNIKTLKKHIKIIMILEVLEGRLFKIYGNEYLDQTLDI